MMSNALARYTVIPAKAGIQEPDVPSLPLDPRFRGGDERIRAQQAKDIR